MSRPGSLSYLKLTPYQTTPYTKSPMSFTSHWFLIRVLTSIINLTTFGNTQKIYFSSENMVATGWFKMYLTQEQLFYLRDSNNFELYPIENIHKTSLLNSLGNEDCYVYASSDWDPPTGSRIISRITDTLFRVKNLTIDDSIKHDDRILTIKPISRKRPTNRYNSGFLQTQHQKSVYDHNIYAPIRSLHNIGLDGRGQVINIVDTGVDVLNAMFYDSGNPLETVSGKTNKNHRKIVRIEKYADDLDYYAGHGTHVSGIAAGRAYCTDEYCGISQYNGIASGSKIYFSDVGYSSVSGDLSEEFDLDEQANLMRSVDSYVSSNSWSYDSPLKEDMFVYDQSSYKHPNLLYFFAAGNDYSYFMINSPSCAKNVVSVGATNSVSSSNAESNTNQVVVENESASFSTCYERSASLIRSYGLASKMVYLVNLSVVIYDSEASLFDNKIVILDFESDVGSTEFCDAYSNAVSKGAEAVIYRSSIRIGCGSFPIPTIYASDYEFDEIKKMKSASILPYSGSDDERLPNIASLSSKGPSDFALSKPDIAVPGFKVTSAKSHGTSSSYSANSNFNSNLVQMSGTSMATPAAAALAIIIRQFFCDGFYPGLKTHSGDSIVPSSCLLRAMLFNSAVIPSNSNESVAGPTHEFGFGIPCLESVFGFKGSGLRVVDNVGIESQKHHVYHIHLDSNSNDLVVTMAYLDPPLNPDNDALFFADLDLFVRTPNGKYFVGNNVGKLADSDSFSSAERVIISKKEIPEDGGDFEIHVTSSEFALFDEKVTYSIVVNGPFEQTVSAKNPLFLEHKSATESDCNNGCSRNGKCNKNGLCECSENFIGASCNTPILTLTDGGSDKAAYLHKQVRYFKLTPLEVANNLTFVDFSLSLSNPRANLFFCTSTEKSPGQITNAGWDCHQSNSVYHSIELPFDEDYKSLMLAVFVSYPEAVSVALSNIGFNSKERPTPAKKPTDKTRILFIAGYVLCGLIAAALVAALIVLVVKLVKRRKQPIVDKEMTEAIVATAGNYEDEV